MKKHDINNKQKREFLKKECKNRLNQNYAPYKSIKSKILDRLIYLQFGKIISDLIKEKTTGNQVLQTLEVLIYGCIILIIFDFLRIFINWVLGNYKDEFLLKTLNEMSYYYRD